ncbi:Dihydroxyacetone synthase [Tulasnella sp. 330]|nr:Dihydroxyacetone synthase [Tulasnella sp. 330]
MVVWTTNTHIVLATNGGPYDDYCGNVSGVPHRYDSSGHRIEGPHYSDCLCYGTLEKRVRNAPPLQDFLKELDQDGRDIHDVYEEVASWLDHSPSWTQCSFPPNSMSRCTPSNLCAFTCTQAGYIPSSSKCVCERPGYRICDGTCSYAPLGCTKHASDDDDDSDGDPTSAKLMQQRDLRPRASGMGKRAEPWNVRNFKPRPRCPMGLTACGVPMDDGRDRRTSWECFDTKDDLENCGGCRVPFPESLQRSTDVPSPRGRDCSTIEGAKKTMCDEGACLVVKCLPGWRVSSTGQKCVRLSISNVADVNAPSVQPERVFSGPWKDPVGL